MLHGTIVQQYVIIYSVRKKKIIFYEIRNKLKYTLPSVSPYHLIYLRGVVGRLFKGQNFNLIGLPALLS